MSKFITIKGVKIDDFTRAYIEAALWSSNDESDESGGEPLDKNYDAFDLAPEALERAAADCRKFQDENVEALARASYGNSEYRDDEMAGHDFWLTRCGHGVGFWDRDQLDKDVRDKLTEAAEKFGECWPYVGDDGQVYL